MMCANDKGTAYFFSWMDFLPNFSAFVIFNEKNTGVAFTLPKVIYLKHYIHLHYNTYSHILRKREEYCRNLE